MPRNQNAGSVDLADRHLLPAVKLRVTLLLLGQRLEGLADELIGRGWSIEGCTAFTRCSLASPGARTQACHGVESLEMADLAKAREFISSADLPPRSAAPVPLGAELATPIFETAKAQATVVGSEVVSFVSGVDSELRSAIMNSALLAQLVASKAVADPKQIYRWYDEYFGALRNIGWAVQDDGFTTYSESGDGFEVHEKMMDVALVLLGPAPAALAVVQATLGALKGMGSDNGWLTIFNRESQHAEAARFQVSVASPSDAGGVVVALMAFGLDANKTVTQVLFFKVSKNQATLRSNTSKATIDRDSLLDLAPDIRERVRSYQRSYIASLKI